MGDIFPSKQGNRNPCLLWRTPSNQELHLTGKMPFWSVVQLCLGLPLSSKGLTPISFPLTRGCSSCPLEFYQFIFPEENGMELNQKFSRSDWMAQSLDDHIDYLLLRFSRKSYPSSNSRGLIALWLMVASEIKQCIHPYQQYLLY